MAEPQFFYRDDDSGDRKRVGKEIEKGGCKPILWETLEELKNGWHNGFVGGATDEQIKKKGKITSGTEDIKKQKEISGFEAPLAVLTNFDTNYLISKYGQGPTGTFHAYFNKEDALIDGSFRNFVQECVVKDAPELEKLAAYRSTLEHKGLSNEPAISIIDNNERTFPESEQMDILRNFSTLDEVCDPKSFMRCHSNSRNILLGRLSKYIEKNCQSQ